MVNELLMALLLAASPTTNILEAWKALPSEATHEYELREKPGGVWVAYDPGLEQENEATVDVKNGFIQVVDEGTGGGTLTLKVALFRTAGGGSVVVLGGQIFDGVADEQELKAFVLEGKKARPAPEVLQALPTVDALLPEGASTEAREQARKHLVLLVEVPRHGTSLTLRLGHSKLAYLCHQEERRDERPAALCALEDLGSIRQSMAWDRKAGRFVRASK